MDELSVVKYLIEVAPVVGVLGWWIYSLKKETEQYRKQLFELNEYVRQLDKDNLTAWSKVIAVVEKLMSDEKTISDNTIREIRDQARNVVAKLMEHINGKFN